MKEKIKISFKNLLENLFGGKKYDLNEKHKLGFTIANFILLKEHIIKKSEINKCSKIYFDFDKNKEYLEPINELSSFVRKDALEIADNGDIELNGTNNESIKDSVWLVHLIRNAFAHGEFTIEDGLFKINNKINEKSTLVCDIPIDMIEKFNNECAKVFNENLDTNYSNDITNFFFNYHLNLNDDRLLYMSLYTYMALTFADMDKDMDVANIKSVYTQPVFTSENHQFSKDTIAVRNCLEDCDKFQCDLNKLYEHLNPKHYDSKLQKENKLRNNLTDKINKRYLQSVRAIRNSIEHANFLINDGGNICLFDMNNQNDLDSKTYEVINTPEYFFTLVRDIDDNNISNDKFAFLNGVFSISDSKFLERLEIIEDYFIELLESDYYIFIIGAEYQNSQVSIIENILYIIHCLKNRVDDYFNTKEMIVKLIGYLEQLAKISEELYNQFDNICFNMYYSTQIDNEEFRKFLFNLYFARMFTIDFLMSQQDVLTIIDNHTLICNEYDYVKKLMK